MMVRKKLLVLPHDSSAVRSFMPRYLFHIRKGDVFTEDPEGIDVPETEDLEEEAIEAARDLLADGDFQGLDRREWVFEITDETGATVLTFPFKDAVEPDLPSSEEEQS